MNKVRFRYSLLNRKADWYADKSTQTDVLDDHMDTFPYEVCCEYSKEDQLDIMEWLFVNVDDNDFDCHVIRFLPNYYWFKHEIHALEFKLKWG